MQPTLTVQSSTPERLTMLEEIRIESAIEAAIADFWRSALQCDRLGMNEICEHWIERAAMLWRAFDKVKVAATWSDQ